MLSPLQMNIISDVGGLDRLRSMCEKHKVSIDTLFSRMEYGYTLKEALGIEGNLKSEELAKKREKYNKTREELANRRKSALEKELKLDAEQVKKLKEVGTAIYVNVDAADSELKIKYRISDRMYGIRKSNKWTREEIFSFANLFNDDTIAVDIFGITYCSMEYMARVYNIEANNIMYMASSRKPLLRFGLEGETLRRRQGTTWNGIEIIQVNEDGTIIIKENGMVKRVANGVELAYISLMNIAEGSN